jgi:hypothetical protein
VTPHSRAALSGLYSNIQRSERLGAFWMLVLMVVNPSKSYGPRGCDVYSAFRSSQIDTCTSCSAPLSVKLFVPAITCILISAQLCVTKKQQVRQPCVIGIGVSLAYPDALGETNRHRSCSRYTVENDRFKSKREIGKAPAGCSAQPINNRYQIKRVKRMLSQ